MKVTKQLILEQGDVVLVPVGNSTVTGDKIRTNVLQEGEHTGHAHRITKGRAEVFGSNGQRNFLRVLKGGATLTHEEHLPVEIGEGDYEIRIVRQKDPFTKLISRVLD